MAIINKIPLNIHLEYIKNTQKMKSILAAQKNNLQADIFQNIAVVWYAWMVYKSLIPLFMRVCRVYHEL